MIALIVAPAPTAEKQEFTCAIDRNRLASIPMWREPVGVTQPEVPVLIEQRYQNGRRSYLFLEPRYQLSNEYLMKLN